MTTANINDFIAQIRFRVREREEIFRRKISGYYSDTGVSGQTGHLVQRSLDALHADFDDLIEELLAYLQRSVLRLAIDKEVLYQSVVSELSQAAIAFKAIVDVNRLVSIARVGRVRMIVDEAFARLDERLTIRLREYMLGLRGDLEPTLEQTIDVSLSERRRQFLGALLSDLQARADNVFVPTDVARSHDLALNPGQLRLIVRELELEELIEPAVEVSSDLPRPNQDVEQYVLTWSGVEEAEKVRGLTATTVVRRIPAANRYVSLSDNAQSELRNDLIALKEEIRGDNEAEEEARLIALSEIAAFEQTIIQPRISTQLIERFLSQTVAWLADTFAKAAVGEIAKRIIAVLGRALSA